MQSHNQNPLHSLLQTYKGRKSVCRVWIIPTDIFLTCPTTSFGVEKHWPDKVNNTSQQSTKEVLVYELEGYFLSIKISNWWENCEHPTITFATTFQYPVGGAKYLWLVFINPIYHFLTHPRISFRIKTLIL